MSDLAWWMACVQDCRDLRKHLHKSVRQSSRGLHGNTLSGRETPVAEHDPTNDFIRRQGPAFLAHLLRRLSDELVRGADDWYPQVGVAAPPRTASTLLALDERGPLGVTEISAL